MMAVGTSGGAPAGDAASAQAQEDQAAIAETLITGYEAALSDLRTGGSFARAAELTKEQKDANFQRTRKEVVSSILSIVDTLQKPSPLRHFHHLPFTSTTTHRPRG